MADIEFRLPKLAMSMVEATIEEWHIQEGNVVADGQEIVSISTDKVDNAIPSPAGGTVTKILVPAGETVAVGTLLAVISAA
jgi:pyruvate/2-oxoglutarate dehydrogenase complex dihydrolipoamide acyltransferase (E2) component